MVNFFIPIISLTFIFGIFGFIIFIVIKAFRNVWKKQTKWFFKYKVMRKKYPEDTVQWCFNTLNNGFGWYDAKKFLLIKMIPDDQLNETLYIYDQIIIELSKEKGGGLNGIRKYEGSNSKNAIATRKLPTTSI